MKNKLKDLEDQVWQLKKANIQHIAAPTGEGDYFNLINEIKEALERDISDLNDKFNGLNNNEDRLKQLEDNVEILKESQDAQDYQLQTLNDKTSDLKEQKIDNTTFDQEINTLKDLLNQLLNKNGDIPKVDLS